MAADAALTVGATVFFATLGWVIYLSFTKDMTSAMFFATYWREYAVLSASLALMALAAPWSKRL